MDRNIEKLKKMNYEVGDGVNEVMNVGVFGYVGGFAFPDRWKLGGGYFDDEGNGSRWSGVGFSINQAINHSFIHSFDHSFIQKNI